MSLGNQSDSVPSFVDRGNREVHRPSTTAHQAGGGCGTLHTQAVALRVGQQPGQRESADGACAASRDRSLVTDPDEAFYARFGVLLTVDLDGDVAGLARSVPLRFPALSMCPAEQCRKVRVDERWEAW